MSATMTASTAVAELLKQTLGIYTNQTNKAKHFKYKSKKCNFSESNYDIPFTSSSSEETEEVDHFHYRYELAQFEKNLAKMCSQVSSNAIPTNCTLESTSSSSTSKCAVHNVCPSPSSKRNNSSLNKVILEVAKSKNEKESSLNSLNWSTDLPSLLKLRPIEKTPRKIYPKLTNLKMIWMNVVSIDEKFARNMESLQKLDISNNKIKILENLPNNVSQVDAFENDIILISNDICKLTHLLHLGLGFNQIENINSLEGLQTSNLLSLDLSYNRLTSLTHFLRCLSMQSNIRHLFLKGNPLCLCKSYRKSVLITLSKLDILDDIEISKEERLYLENKEMIQESCEFVIQVKSISGIPSVSTPHQGYCRKYIVEYEIPTLIGKHRTPPLLREDIIQYLDTQSFQFVPTVQLRDAIALYDMKTSVVEVLCKIDEIQHTQDTNESLPNPLLETNNFNDAHESQDCCEIKSTQFVVNDYFSLKDFLKPKPLNNDGNEICISHTLAPLIEPKVMKTWQRDLNQLKDVSIGNEESTLLERVPTVKIQLEITMNSSN